MKSNAANRITVARVVMVPLFMILAYSGYRVLAFVVYIIACISDFADGFIARKFHQVTNFGKFMDPLADKMLTLAALCFLCDRGQVSGWIIAIILFREFSVSGLRLIAAENKRVIAAAKAGKAKTAVTMVCIALMLLISSDNSIVNTVCSWSILILTIYSGIYYFILNKDILKQ